MKKRLMMVAVLIGALSLGACVDNKESDSVVAVRTAKAAQLNSIAAMNNAEADMKKAMAAYEKAKAEIEQVQADKDKAGLETYLEAAKVDAEAALETAKAGLEKAKAELIASLDKVDQATKERTLLLLTKANAVLNGGDILINDQSYQVVNYAGLNSDRTSLIKAKDELAKLKAGLISAELSNKTTIVEEEKKKASANALIAEYEKYSKEDKANAEKAAKEVRAKAIALVKIKDEKKIAFTNAGNALTKAKNNLDGSRYAVVLKNLGANYYETTTVAEENVYFTHDDATTDFVTKSGYDKLTPVLARFNEDITRDIRNRDVAKATLADATKALADKKETESYKDLQKKYTEALKKFEDAKTAAEKQTAKGELEQAESDLKNATSGLETAVKDADTDLQDWERSLEYSKDNLAAVSGDNQKAYESLLGIYETALTDKVNADIAQKKATNNWDLQDKLATALETVAGGLADYDGLILAQQQVIATADEEIAKAKSIVTEEQAIANKEKEIANYEANLVVYEPMYQNYLDQIKALAEGGTVQ